MYWIKDNRIYNKKKKEVCPSVCPHKEYVNFLIEILLVKNIKTNKWLGIFKTNVPT